MPSRMFVGLTVFGLIVTLLVVPLTVLVLVGFQPAPDAPYEVVFPDREEAGIGTKVFLVVASLFSVAFTLLAWRALLAGARHDRDGPRKRPGEGAASRDAAGRDRDGPAPPPGYQ